MKHPKLKSLRFLGMSAYDVRFAASVLDRASFQMANDSAAHPSENYRLDLDNFKRHKAMNTIAHLLWQACGSEIPDELAESASRHFAGLKKKP